MNYYKQDAYMYDNFYKWQARMIHAIGICRGVIKHTRDIIVSLPKPKQWPMTHTLRDDRKFKSRNYFYHQRMKGPVDDIHSNILL